MPKVQFGRLPRFGALSRSPQPVAAGIDLGEEGARSGLEDGACVVGNKADPTAGRGDIIDITRSLTRRAGKIYARPDVLSPAAWHAVVSLATVIVNRVPSRGDSHFCEKNSFVAHANAARWEA